MYILNRLLNVVTARTKTSGSVHIWRTPKEAYNLECLVSTVKYGGGSVMVWVEILRYIILLVPLFPFMGK